MTHPTSRRGDICLGHILESAGLTDLSDVLVVRHTYTEDGIQPGGVTGPDVLAYTRRQRLRNKISQTPPPLWLVFMADGARRSRFFVAYENHGEVVAERTEALRYFDLRPSEVLSSLAGRLVVEWSKDPVNWAKPGPTAAAFPVIEIADPEVVAFPGFDHVLLTYAKLQQVVEESRYEPWRTALGAVKGIYLIADSTTGRLYVGKANGGERILGRWSSYARSGHGGNVAFKELAGLDPAYTQNYVFSVLRVFDPVATDSEIDAAESHYKRALLTRRHGLNRN